MASKSTCEDYYILLEDAQGVNSKTFRKSIRLRGSSSLRHRSRSVLVLHGELLTSISQEIDDIVTNKDTGKPTRTFRSIKDPHVTLCSREADIYVSPVNEKELHLLEAIEGPSDRFSVFSEPSKLTWGGSLKKGDQVYVKIPMPNTTVPTWSMALVQYAGPVETLPGWNFGIEIKVNKTPYKLDWSICSLLKMGTSPVVTIFFV